MISGNATPTVAPPDDMAPLAREVNELLVKHGKTSRELIEYLWALRGEPYVVVRGVELLYPQQADPIEQVAIAMERDDWRGQIVALAQAALETGRGVDRVRERWQALTGGWWPSGYGFRRGAAGISFRRPSTKDSA